MKNEFPAFFPSIRYRTFPAISGLAALVIAIFWAVLLLFFPGPGQFPIFHDAPLFHYIAQRIMLGDVPYRDLVDMNFPGIYALHIFILAVFGPSNLGWAVFNYLWLGLTAIITGLFCWRISRLAALLAPGLVISAVVLLGIYNFGQRDYFLLLFLLIAMHLFANVLEERTGKGFSTNLQLFLSGICFGLACSIKPTPIILLISFLVLLFIAPLPKVSGNGGKQPGVDEQKRLYRARFHQSLFLIAGTALVALAFTGWLAFSGGLQPFLSFLFQYNLPIYSSLHRYDTGQLISKLFLDYWILDLFFPLLGIGLLFSIRKTGAIPIRIWLAFLAVLFGAFHYIFQGKAWPYQLIPFLVFILLFQAILCCRLLKSKLPAQALALTWLLITTTSLGLLLSQVYRPPNPLEYFKPVVPELVKDLHAIGLKQEDPIQVMDVTEGGIHALYKLGQRQSSRFIYDFFFLKEVDQPIVQQYQSEFMADLQGNPPLWIVIFNNGWEQQETGLDRFNDFPQFRQLIHDHYTLVVDHPEYLIFRDQRP